MSKQCNVIITICLLHTDGRLSIGDLIYHGRLGLCTFVNAIDDGRLLLKTAQGEKHVMQWHHGGRLVPARAVGGAQ